MVVMVDIVHVEVYVVFCFFFFFKQKTAYEMRISDWSSDVCSSDLLDQHHLFLGRVEDQFGAEGLIGAEVPPRRLGVGSVDDQLERGTLQPVQAKIFERTAAGGQNPAALLGAGVANIEQHRGLRDRWTEMEDRKSTRLNYSH